MSSNVGVQFPSLEGSTAVAKDIMATSIEHIDPSAAAIVRGEKNWRYAYNKHFLRNAQLSAKNTANAVEIAKAGIARVRPFDAPIIIARTV